MTTRALALCLALLAAPAAADAQSALTIRLLPGFHAFTEAAAALQAAARDCPSEALAPAYHAAVDAWMAVGDLRISPSEEGALSIAFWPDDRGFTARTLSRMVAAEDPVANDPAAYAEVSIAARGLMALDMLLFDPGFTLEAGRYTCTLVQTVTVDLAAQAVALEASWTGTFAEALTTPGAPGNVLYLTPDEALRAVYTQLLAGLEMTADSRLGRPMGSFARPHPRLAEAWRSGRSLRNVVLSVEAAQTLAHALADRDLPRTDAAVAQVHVAAGTIDDGSFLAAGAAPGLSWADAGSPAYLAAACEGDGRFALFGLDRDGGATFRVLLPARGHAGAGGHPTRAVAVAFARRPGTCAQVLDCIRGTVRHRLTPHEGRQFNGHGVYAQGGAVLFTVEQASTDSTGVIGVWDVLAGYRRMGEFATRGIDPHDLRLMADARTLVVANGGIATDPTDRTKMNIPRMRPNLRYLDLTGMPLEQVELEPDLHRASIRHPALRADGLVSFAMQWEGDDGAAPPLLGLHRRGMEPLLAEAPLGDELLMRGYAGSIAFAGDGAELAISSPRGGWLHRFSDNGDFLGAVPRADVCGLASLGSGYLASDGLGGLIAVDPGGARVLGRHPVAWDNHIVALAG